MALEPLVPDREGIALAAVDPDTAGIELVAAVLGTGDIALWPDVPGTEGIVLVAPGREGIALALAGPGTRDTVQAAEVVPGTEDIVRVLVQMPVGLGTVGTGLVVQVAGRPDLPAVEDLLREINIISIFLHSNQSSLLP